jgi:hypothetical protein
MKESYGEGLANHTSLESCGNCSNAMAEALTEEMGTGTYCITHQTEGGLSADYLTAD